MELKTERLVLRSWRDSDAESLYEYAKDSRVGPIAGWPVHTSVENSVDIIKHVLCAKGTYAITLKNDDKAIGSIGLMIGNQSNLNISDDEGEIGYWIGVPFWGKGYVPEAVNELMRYAFEDLHLHTLWCGYFEGNDKSKRVSEKCGFEFHHTEFEKEWSSIGETKNQHITVMRKEDWKKKF